MWELGELTCLLMSKTALPWSVGLLGFEIVSILLGQAVLLLAQPLPAGMLYRAEPHSACREAELT